MTLTEDVTRLPRLTEALLRKGYSESDVRKILGENLLRVMARAEEMAAARVMHYHSPGSVRP